MQLEKKLKKIKKFFGLNGKNNLNYTCKRETTCFIEFMDGRKLYVYKIINEIFVVKNCMSL